MMELNQKLERTIVICAERATVFRYFTDSKRFAAWWGTGSIIEGKPGGKVLICYPGFVVASGQVLEITENERVVFTYGYESGSQIPIPPGASRVTITMRDHPQGTELNLSHEFSDATVRDRHIQGWRYQLALFANVVCKEQHAGYTQLLDDYFSIWSISDVSSRKKMLERIAADDVRFRDAYGCVTGREELSAHIAASQMFMPGLTLLRDGEPFECQGTAMSRWIAKRNDGTEAARGTNIFHFTPNGSIQSIVGFWMPAERTSA